MVIINFALEKLGTQIKSDKVSVDGYGADNLLLDTSVWQKKGFLAERFIKPPVTITLTLPCPVNLCRIVLDPQVGGQRSSAIEIYTAVKHRGWKYTKTGNANSVGTLKANTDSHDTTSEPIFVRVGSTRCTEPGKVCFTNPQFHSDSALIDNLPSIDSFKYQAQIRHHQSWAVSAVESVAVRITNTVSGKVAALGSLELWGVPARSCPPHLKEDIIAKYFLMIQPLSLHTLSKDGVNTKHSTTKKTASIHPQETRNALQTSGRSSMSISDWEAGTGSQSVEDTSDQLQIPDEFLDPLTFEVMVTPMLLPSGKTVDLSTIERFSDVEATHGRQASDPFTGLAFTSTRRPVLNKNLKVRIDRFLSENAANPALMHVPRVLGHREGVGETGLNLHQGKPLQNGVASIGVSLSTFQAAQSVSSLTVKQERTSVLKRKHLESACSDSRHNLSTHVPKKRCDTGVRGDTLQNTFGVSSTDSLSVTSTVLKEEMADCTAVLQRERDVTSTHEDRLRHSLSHSLSSVLLGLPSFTTPPPPKPAPEIQCCVCGKKQEQLRSILYKLPCDHVICRACLTVPERTGHFSCPNCQSECKRADIVRIHV